MLVLQLLCTGVLDTNKLHTYRYNEDIFKKVTVMPDGKNHGLIMLLDWSGSMGQILMDTLKQTYNLVWFCRKVGIPFRVYAFQSGFSPLKGVNQETAVDNNLLISEDFRLLELFSSKMNAKQLDKQMQYVWAQSYDQTHYTSHHSIPEFGLGGTPLAEATICMREAVKQMKAVDKVQKVNVVALTDGELILWDLLPHILKDITGKVRSEESISVTIATKYSFFGIL